MVQMDYGYIPQLHSIPTAVDFILEFTICCTMDNHALLIQECSSVVEFICDALQVCLSDSMGLPQICSCFYEHLERYSWDHLRVLV